MSALYISAAGETEFLAVVFFPLVLAFSGVYDDLWWGCEDGRCLGSVARGRSKSRVVQYERSNIAGGYVSCMFLFLL
jgi:hypothetical protein